MEDGLPGWASVALTQACRDENWIPLCDILHGEIKQQLEGNLVSKRFSELTETEQASLVEHHYRELCIRGNKDHLEPFTAVMNRAVDEQLLHIILQKSLNKDAVRKSGYASINGPDFSSAAEEEKKSKADEKDEVTKETTLDFLMGEISGAVIELLEKSAPALRNTLVMFLNKPLPTQIRIYVWSKSLRLDQQRLEDGSALFGARIAPSVDLILSRRCHALLDTSFSVVSSRANASFVKTILTNFMRLAGMKVPDTASDNFEVMEHLAYLLIPLLIILRSNMYDLLLSEIKDNTTMHAVVAVQGENEEDVPPGHPLLGHDPKVAPGTIEFYEDNYTTNLGSKINATKRINIMENALYSLLEPRFLGLVELAVQEKKKKKKKGDEADKEAAEAVKESLSASSSRSKKKNKDSVSGTFKFVQRAPGMGQAVTLLEAKVPKLAKMLLSLEKNAVAGGITEADLGYGSTAPSGRVKEHEITYFVLSQATNWKEFMNEMLLRGLSGLLNLEVTLFLWDQGFVTDFGAMLPLALVALIAGASPEIGALVSYRNVVETFISYCRTVDVEQMQKLLMKHCRYEMKEFGEMEVQPGRDDEVMTENFRKIEMNM